MVLRHDPRDDSDLRRDGQFPSDPGEGLEPCEPPDAGGLPPSRSCDERPTIVISGRQFRDVLGDAWEAILAYNDPPRVFQRSGALVRIRQTDNGLILETMDTRAAFGLLAEVATWQRLRERGGEFQEYHVKPDRDVAAVVTSDPDPRLPPIEAIAEAPLFAAGGELVTARGYHRAARAWLEPKGLRVPRVSPSPSEAEVETARRWLLEELLCDFSFARPSDRAHAVAALVQPFVRRMIGGCTPVYLIEASAHGSGKTLFSSIVGIVALGSPPAPMTLPRQTDEARKRITAALERGQAIISLDNVGHHLDSADLAATLTAERWADRVLGETRLLDLPNHATWLLTANNASMSLEIARRCVRIRLEPPCERPWERRGFKHELPQWAVENRPRLVWALLTLAQAWIAAGRPPSSARLGSFERWASTIGGILEVAGLEGFLADQGEFYDAADAETNEWALFVSAWWGTFETQAATATELYRLAVERELLADVLGDKTERSQKTRLGRALGRMRGRWFGGMQIVRRKDTDSNLTTYALARQAP